MGVSLIYVACLLYGHAYPWSSWLGNGSKTGAIQFQQNWVAGARLKWRFHKTNLFYINQKSKECACCTRINPKMLNRVDLQ